ncbi:MAG: 50S ribosomal protein L29 [SAR202 cluster bacterium]|nr:50S ribosomal protein L29 [Chloroflexota bacterium]MQF84968.1 50S ribosomal protein L29 [SAR202 cluster bacterium]MQF93022.1 50S ribosomal protein L29 [SAR202 cluster bacterium]|tara:strand:- start:1414 stop:1647 length:234 start_codon:yes stop_codon:yes gene_type:complete
MNIEDVRKLNNEELLNEKESILKTIMENRFKHKSMQLSDTSQINKLRKDKARIMTVINERKIIEQLDVDEKENQDGQ